MTELFFYYILQLTANIFIYNTLYISIKGKPRKYYHKKKTAVPRLCVCVYVYVCVCIYIYAHCVYIHTCACMCIFCVLPMCVN